MDRLLRLWRLPASEKLRLCEAAALLLLSALGVRTVAFRHIDRFLRTRWAGVPRRRPGAAEIRLVELSVARAARLAPWAGACLSRSIATYVMLRRRGIPAVLFAGARLAGESSIHAHAWVGTGDEAAGESAEGARYATLVTIGQEPVDG